MTVTSATATTVVLQRGLTGYAGASDTFLDNYLRTTVRGAADPLYLDGANYTPLLRFAIFQSEGGPVPNGAAIQSAKLELYKQYYSNTLQLNALLKPWVESQATWDLSQAGVAVERGGAAGAGTDYVTATDALVAVGFDPGWVGIRRDTARCSSGQPALPQTIGWRLAQTVADVVNAIQFNSSEYAADPTLRPKLTIVYSSGTSDVPPTVSITTPTAGAAVTLGQSFTLTASANDTDGTVTKVDYYANGAPIGMGTVSPYTLVWTPGAAGSYSLTAIATDNGLATTTSAPANVTVNPVVTSSPVLQGASMRRTHNAAGTFDLSLSLATTSPTTEPRTGPAHTLVFTFDKPITGATVAVTEGSATAAVPAFSGNEVVVALTNVTNQQYVTIALTSVTASDGGTGGFGTVRIGLLAGDTSQDRVVTIADVALVNAALAQPVTVANFLRDIDGSGSITVGDKAFTNGQLAKGLPAP